MTRRVERGLWMMAAMFAAIALLGWRTPTSRAPEAVRRVPLAASARTTKTETASVALTSLAEQVVARDPFRLERRPSAVAFGAPVAPTAQPDASRRPRLLVSGIFGPPWQAVMEGIPGRDGSVVARVGDVFGELRVRSIRRDTVVVQGADTTWKLTVRKVW